MVMCQVVSNVIINVHSLAASGTSHVLLHRPSILARASTQTKYLSTCFYTDQVS